mmetsp:Transcript_30648/g.70755  ORF Transcript_30648/g.70755 Transcript_30648/m.70755 type:complete len:228 (+) Transcript_30648:32-715(+)
MLLSNCDNSCRRDHCAVVPEDPITYVARITALALHVLLTQLFARRKQVPLREPTNVSIVHPSLFANPDAGGPSVLHHLEDLDVITLLNADLALALRSFSRDVGVSGDANHLSVSRVDRDGCRLLLRRPFNSRDKFFRFRLRLTLRSCALIGWDISTDGCVICTRFLRLEEGFHRTAEHVLLVGIRGAAVVASNSLLPGNALRVLPKVTRVVLDVMHAANLQVVSQSL